MARSEHEVMVAWPDNRITFLGRTNWRNERRTFGIKQADRRHHMYVIGKTGTGKSTLLETMIRQDIGSDQGLALFDPHGDLIERLLAVMPERRKGDLIYFNVPDSALPLGFNPLESVPPAKRPLAASGMVEVFKKIWADSWGPRSEHLLRNALLALLDQPEATLADVLRLFDDPVFRKKQQIELRTGKSADFGCGNSKATRPASALRPSLRSKIRWARFWRTPFSTIS